MASLFDKVRSGCNGVTKKILRKFNRCNSQMYLLIGNFALQLRIPYNVLLFTVNFKIQISGKQWQSIQQTVKKKFKVKNKRTVRHNSDNNRRQKRQYTEHRAIFCFSAQNQCVTSLQKLTTQVSSHERQKKQKKQPNHLKWDINRANHNSLKIKEWRANNDWDSYKSAVIMEKEIWKERKQEPHSRWRLSMNHCNASVKKKGCGGRTILGGTLNYQRSSYWRLIQWPQVTVFPLYLLAGLYW